MYSCVSTNLLAERTNNGRQFVLEHCFPGACWALGIPPLDACFFLKLGFFNSFISAVLAYFVPFLSSGLLLLLPLVMLTGLVSGAMAAISGSFSS